MEAIQAKADKLEHAVRQNSKFSHRGPMRRLQTAGITGRDLMIRKQIQGAEVLNRLDVRNRRMIAY